MSRNYLEAFVILIISFALGFFLVLPKYQELQLLQQQIDEKTSEIEFSQAYYAELEEIIDELNQYSDSWSKVDTALAEGIDAPATMNFLQTAAAQTGLITRSIDYIKQGGGSPVASSKKDPAAAKNSLLQKYKISMNLSGSYENFKNFLSIIEHSSRLIAVETVVVDTKNQKEKGKDDSSGAEKIINYDVDFSVNYYEKS